MAIKIRRITVSKDAGAVIVELQSFRALPMEVVMSTVDKQIIKPEPRIDPTFITWRLPPEENRYIVYGIITPLKRLWRKPSYGRVVVQDGRLCKMRRGRNPARFRARKLNAGEWAGLPEVIFIRTK